MKKFIWPIAFLLAFAVPTLAQQQAPELTLKVTGAEVDTIGKGLGKLPFDDVAGLIQKLRQQIVEQQKPVEAPVAPKPKE